MSQNMLKPGMWEVTGSYALVDKAVDEIKAALPPLLEGFFVKADDSGTAVIVGNDELAFALTFATIKDNLHVMQAKQSFPTLLKALAQHHAMLAGKYDRDMLFLIADGLRSNKNVEVAIADFKRRGRRTELGAP